MDASIEDQNLLLPWLRQGVLNKFRRREGRFPKEMGRTVTMQSSGDVPCGFCSNLQGTSPAILARSGKVAASVSDAPVSTPPFGDVDPGPCIWQEWNLYSSQSPSMRGLFVQPKLLGSERRKDHGGPRRRLKNAAHQLCRYFKFYRKRCWSGKVPVGFGHLKKHAPTLLGRVGCA